MIFKIISNFLGVNFFLTHTVYMNFVFRHIALHLSKKCSNERKKSCCRFEEQHVINWALIQRVLFWKCSFLCLLTTMRMLLILDWTLRTILTPPWSSVLDIPSWPPTILGLCSGSSWPSANVAVAMTLTGTLGATSPFANVKSSCEERINSLLYTKGPRFDSPDRPPIF